MNKIQVALGSRIGGRAENQDSCLSVDTPFGVLALVCDGMGGGPGGKFASSSAVSLVKQYILDQYERKISEADIVLEEAIHEANKYLYEYSCEHEEFRGMGTTIVAVLINNDCAIVAHVGDSRLYQLRKGKKVFRTFDHSMVFERVKNERRFTEEDARVSKGSNVITRALGVRDKVLVDMMKLSYERGDRFVLCTDGIWGAFPEKEVIKYVSEPMSISGAVENIVLRVDKRGFAEGGRHDNLTVAILDVQHDSKYKEPMSRKLRHFFMLLLAVLAVSLSLNAYFIISSKNMESEQENGTGQALVKEEVEQIEKEVKAEPSAAQSNPDENKNGVIEKLDEIISILEELKTQKMSNARNKKIEKLGIDIEELKKETVKYGISLSEWEKIGEEIGKKRMKQDDSQVKNNAVSGHYNSVILKIKQIKEKLEN